MLNSIKYCCYLRSMGYCKVLSGVKDRLFSKHSLQIDSCMFSFQHLEAFGADMLLSLWERFDLWSLRHNSFLAGTSKSNCDVSSVPELLMIDILLD